MRFPFRADSILEGLHRQGKQAGNCKSCLPCLGIQIGIVIKIISILQWEVKKKTTKRCEKISNRYSNVSFKFILNYTTIHRYPIFSTRYSVMCKVYTGYCGTSEIEHGLCACTVNNPLAKGRGLSLGTGTQTMLYLSHN